MVEQEKRKFRTAVLVVHGMGSQRPLETVRGVVDAVWFDKTSKNNTGSKRIWTHPEPSGVDIDLTVMTTNAISGIPGEKTADFHELYWAHLMSETRAVAVLLWLFELARKGPRFTTAMNALWYCVATYLCLLLLSVSLLVLQFTTRFANIVREPYGTPAVLLVMLVAGVAYARYKTPRQDWPMLTSRLNDFLRSRSFVYASLVVALAILFLWIFGLFGSVVYFISSVFLVPALASAAAYLLMKDSGFQAMSYAIVASFVFFGLYVILVGLMFFVPHLWAGDLLTSASGFLRCDSESETLGKIFCEARLPWSLGSDWSSVAAWAIIGIYLAINAAFLQPYLGDAARYFRNSPANIAVRREIRKQAVDTLDMLHRLHLYDRIIVVAHSLGTVVAYDMLRAYYSRICDRIAFDPNQFHAEFGEVDGGTLGRDELRAKGREIIRRMALNIPADQYDKPIPAGKPPEAWLVTDFVTLGSPLTHARYLMCNGESLEELNEDFSRRLIEREFPSCPPTTHPNDPDGWLAFKKPGAKQPTLHHGGMFALTRWTNLYFPMTELFWGDPVGGPVGAEKVGKNTQPLFGAFVCDKEVCLSKPEVKDFFTHTAYWSLKRGNGYDSPHIHDLIKAINLEDKPESKS